MNKNRLLIFLIAGLLISNILLVVFMMKGKGPGHHGPPPHHRGGGPRDLIIERLHFDEGQIEQFEKLIHEHRKNVNAEDEALLNIKNTLYNNLKSDENKTVTDSLINAMESIHNKIEHIHYSHFEDIKKLCKPEQMKDFNVLATELARLFGPPKGPPPPHHKPH